MLDFKSNLTLRAKMALTKKALKAKFDCTCLLHSQFSPFFMSRNYITFDILSQKENRYFSNYS